MSTINAFLRRVRIGFAIGCVTALAVCTSAGARPIVAGYERLLGFDQADAAQRGRVRKRADT